MEEEKEDQGFSTDVGTPIPAPAKEKKADAQGKPASSSSSSLKSDVATADNLTSWVCRAYDKASAIPDDIRHRIHSLDELLHFLKARRNDLRNGSLGDKIRRMIDVPEVRESVEYCREPLQHCRELMANILEMSNSTFTSLSFYQRPKKFRKRVLLSYTILMSAFDGVKVALAGQQSSAGRPSVLPSRDSINAMMERQVQSILAASAANSMGRQVAAEGDATSSPETLCNIADRLMTGLGSVQSPKLAADYYRRAADEGYTRAMNALAAMHLKGNGIPANVQKARELFLASANGGDLDGMNEVAKLGIMELSSGESSEPPVSDTARKEAINFLRRSAVQGHLDAMTNAGLVCLRSHLYHVLYLSTTGIIQGSKPSPALAAEWFRKAADQGFTRAQNLLGTLLLRGGSQSRMGRRRRPLGTMEYEINPYQDLNPRKSEGGGNAGGGRSGQAGSASEDDHDDELGVDAKGASLYFRLAAEAGDATACNNLGILYERGEGVPKNLEAAADLYRRASDKGHPAARNNLGYVLLRMSAQVGLDCPKGRIMVEKAAALFRRSIDGYLGGEGSRASTALRPSAAVPPAQDGEIVAVALTDNHHISKTFDPTADAHYNLSILFSTGRGVPKDPRRAFEHAKAAADSSQGHASAARQVATMYYSGFGVPQNYKMAIKYYETSFTLSQKDFDAGDDTARAIVSDSANALGIMYEDGRGVSEEQLSKEQRILEAARWYRRAVRATNPHAMYNLAALHLEGRGVVRDVQVAVQLLDDSARLGFEHSRTKLRQMQRAGVPFTEGLASLAIEDRRRPGSSSKGAVGRALLKGPKQMSSGELGGLLEALDAGGKMQLIGDSRQQAEADDTFARTAEDAAVARAHERAERYRREALEEAQTKREVSGENPTVSRFRDSDLALREARMHAEQVRELGRVL